MTKHTVRILIILFGFIYCINYMFIFEIIIAKLIMMDNFDKIKTAFVKAYLNPIECFLQPFIIFQICIVPFPFVTSKLP